MLKNLRESTSHEKVRQFHEKMYRPDNMAIVCAGQIEAEAIIEVLEKFEQKILAKVTIYYFYLFVLKWWFIFYTCKTAPANK